MRLHARSRACGARRLLFVFGMAGGLSGRRRCGRLAGADPDDVYRGVSMTCGHPAAQADLHLRERGAGYWAVFAGVWGSAGLSGAPCGTARELDLYAGYNVALGPISAPPSPIPATPSRAAVMAIPHLSGERYDYDQLGMSLVSGTGSISPLPGRRMHWPTSATASSSRPSRTAAPSPMARNGASPSSPGYHSRPARATTGWPTPSVPATASGTWD